MTGYADQKNRSLLSSVLLITGTLLSLGSAFAFIWGQSYVRSNQLTGLATLFGYEDSTYTLALWARTLGALGFFSGLGFLFAGFLVVVLKKR